MCAIGRDVFARGEASLALHLALQPASSRSRFPLRDDCGPVRLAVLRQPPTAPGDQQATGSDIVGGSQAGGLVPVQNDVADVPAGVAVILSPSGAPWGEPEGLTA